MTYFLADGKARYIINGNVAKAERSGTEYTSDNHSLKITGKYRNQPKVGWGARAVFTLDTGEGLVDIPGVVR